MNEIAYEGEDSRSSSGWWLLFLVGLLSIVVGVIILCASLATASTPWP